MNTLRIDSSLGHYFLFSKSQELIHHSIRPRCWSGIVSGATDSSPTSDANSVRWMRWTWSHEWDAFDQLVAKNLILLRSRRGNSTDRNHMAITLQFLSSALLHFDKIPLQCSPEWLSAEYYTCRRFKEVLVGCGSAAIQWAATEDIVCCGTIFQWFCLFFLNWIPCCSLLVIGFLLFALPIGNCTIPGCYAN